MSALRAPTRRRSLQAGFSLIELLVAITLSLIIAGGLTTVFVANSRSRDAAEQTSQQIENGRYAMEVLSQDLRMSGYWAEFDIANAGLATPGVKPDPCSTTLSDLAASLPLHVQGYDNGAVLSCLADVRSNTDIVAVRHAEGCIAGSTDCSPPAGAPLFQASLCNNDTELGSAATTDQYRLSSVASQLDRHQRDCTTVAESHAYLARIYFIANDDLAGDGIPTLKRAELGAAGFTIVPIAEGIENLQVEYGIDTDGDGSADAYTADPDSFNACTAAACVENWRNTVAARISLLVRTSAAVGGGYADAKTYQLGLDADGSTHTVGPFNDAYKRHAYRAVVRLNNPAGRREQ